MEIKLGISERSLARSKNNRGSILDKKIILINDRKNN